MSSVWAAAAAAEVEHVPHQPQMLVRAAAAVVARSLQRQSACSNSARRKSWMWDAAAKAVRLKLWILQPVEWAKAAEILILVNCCEPVEPLAAALAVSLAGRMVAVVVEEVVKSLEHQVEAEALPRLAESEQHRQIAAHRAAVVVAEMMAQLFGRAALVERSELRRAALL